mgnify:FL=1
MRGNNNRKVGDIIRKLMRNPKLSEKLDKLDALQAWEEIIGKQLCKYVLEQKIFKGILYVKLKSAVVRNELSYKKSIFVKEINQKIGKNLITDIVLK